MATASKNPAPKRPQKSLWEQISHRKYPSVTILSKAYAMNYLPTNKKQQERNDHEAQTYVWRSHLTSFWHRQLCVNKELFHCVKKRVSYACIVVGEVQIPMNCGVSNKVKEQAKWNPFALARLVTFFIKHFFLKLCLFFIANNWDICFHICYVRKIDLPNFGSWDNNSNRCPNIFKNLTLSVFYSVGPFYTNRWR